MLEFLDKNKEWIFSGAGITLVTLLVLFGRRAFGALLVGGPTVRVSRAIMGTPMTGPVDVLAITVQNRTGQVLYLGTVFLELVTREQFIPTLDPLTGTGQGRRELQPGDSFGFHILAHDIIRSGLPLEAFRCAAVRDAVDRVYRPSGGELRRALTLITRRRHWASSPQ
jgi:hypothetical protein